MAKSVPAVFLRHRQCRQPMVYPLGPVGIFPASISAQHALKKADLLCDYFDSLFFRQRLGNRTPGINCLQLADCSSERSSRVRH
jgi:hypothetical protein